MTDLQHLIATRLDLESSRPHLIAAIRRTQGQPVQRRLIGIRDLLDAAIDDLYHEQKAEGVAA